MVDPSFDIDAWVGPLIPSSDRRILRRRAKELRDRNWEPGIRSFSDATRPFPLPKRHESTSFDKRFQQWIPGDADDSDHVLARLRGLGAKPEGYLFDAGDYGTKVDLRKALQRLDGEVRAGRQDAILLCVPGVLAFYQTHHGDRVIVSTSFSQTPD